MRNDCEIMCQKAKYNIVIVTNDRKSFILVPTSALHFRIQGNLSLMKADNQKYGPHITKKGPPWALTTRAKIYQNIPMRPVYSTIDINTWYQTIY